MMAVLPRRRVMMLPVKRFIVGLLATRRCSSFPRNYSEAAASQLVRKTCCPLRRTVTVTRAVGSYCVSGTLEVSRFSSTYDTSTTCDQPLRADTAQSYESTAGE